MDKAVLDRAKGLEVAAVAVAGEPLVGAEEDRVEGRDGVGDLRDKAVGGISWTETPDLSAGTRTSVSRGRSSPGSGGRRATTSSSSA